MGLSLKDGATGQAPTHRAHTSFLQWVQTSTNKSSELVFCLGKDTCCHSLSGKCFPTGFGSQLGLGWCCCFMGSENLKHKVFLEVAGHWGVGRRWESTILGCFLFTLCLWLTLVQTELFIRMSSTVSRTCPLRP